MLCRPARSSDWLVSVNRNSEFDLNASSRIECEIVLSSSSGSPLEFRPAPGAGCPSSSFRKTYPRSARVSFNVASSRVTRISSSTPAVFSLRAASRKRRQLFQIGGISGDLNTRNLAEEFARCVRGGVLGMENHVGDIAHAELHPIVALQRCR